MRELVRGKCVNNALIDKRPTNNAENKIPNN